MAKKGKIRNDTVLKIIRKLLWRGVILFFSISILSVIVLNWLPVKYTPLMFLRFIENIDDNSYRSIRKWKSLDEISENMIKAALAAEDANFMEHFGFDWEAIKRAMDFNRRGGKKYGASTITQQTAKNVYLTPSRSWFRKGLEAYFTILIEVFWTKERIIEIYLNVIEVGNGLYGVEAAAQTYFNKPANKLTVFEACQIASILPNPREYKIANPTRELQKKQRKIKQSMEYIKWKGRKRETEY